MSMFSSAVFFQIARDFFIPHAQFGSTHIILVFWFSAFVALIIPEINHHHQIGHII